MCHLDALLIFLTSWVIRLLCPSTTLKPSYWSNIWTWLWIVSFRQDSNDNQVICRLIFSSVHSSSCFLISKRWLLLLDGLFSHVSVHCWIISSSWFSMAFLFNVLGLNQTSEGLPKNLKTHHFSWTYQRAEVAGQPTNLKSKGRQAPPRRKGPWALAWPGQMLLDAYKPVTRI